VSAERVLSGPGLEDLLWAILQLEGVAPGPSAAGAAEITARALSGRCRHCVETLHTFCALLGTVAGDLALTLGARGGVFIGGGIVPRLGDFFATSAFRPRFEDKGRFSGYLARIPTRLIRSPHPALLGAARALDNPHAGGHEARRTP
jgi:glucokinase